MVERAEAGSPPMSDRVTIRRVEAVVNAASGSVETGAAAELERLLAGSGASVRVHNADPREIAAAVRSAVGADPDLVVVLAGDGTARLAAELCGPKGPLVAPLPGGTMNMLPHALYGERTWQEALQAALEAGVRRPVSGGEVSGQPFYVAAILGAPALWAEAREAMREMHLAEAWRRGRAALSRAFRGRVRFSLDGRDVESAEALTLMCPLVSRALQRDDALEAAALDPHGAADALRLGLNTLTGRWREDPSVNVEICTSGRVWSRRHIPAVLDGEPTRLERTAELRFIPEAFQAFAPPRDPETRSQAEGEGERSAAEAAGGAAMAGAVKPA